MGDVIPFKKPRRVGVKGAARALLTEAFEHVGEAHFVVLYVQNKAGVFAVRAVVRDEEELFDAYARAEAAIGHSKMQFIDTSAEHEFR